MKGYSKLESTGSDFAYHFGDNINQESFIQSLEDMAAIIAIEGGEDSSSVGEHTNGTFILVNPTSTVTDGNKQE